MPRPRVSLVIPAFNEEAGLPELWARVRPVLDRLGGGSEVILVDDGSSDGSLALLHKLAHDDGRVRVLALSRNFGHQTAISAGLAHARGERVAVIDADLQDPPELLEPMLALLESGGYDVVYGVRARRPEGLVKRALYHGFYRVLHRISDTEIPVDAGDFCVMSRRVADLLVGLPEGDRYLRGLRSWVGFRQAGFPYAREARNQGAPKYTIRKLLDLSSAGILSFSVFPLRAIVLFGLLISAMSFAGILLVLYFRLFTAYSVPGFASVAIMMLGLGGIQLLTLGVIGEYVGRIFREVKRRPLWVVRERIGFEEEAPEEEAGR